MNSAGERVVLLPDFVSEDEAAEIVAALPRLDVGALYERVANAIEWSFRVTLERDERSRETAKIETNPAGHPWHYDGAVPSWETAA